MYRIALLNMPLANLAAPSIALTQLEVVTKRRFGDEVAVEIHYLNQDFARFLTVDAYEEMNSFAHHPAGLGEWFFRQAAFPELRDSAEAYFTRYYPQHDPRNRMIRSFVMEKRAMLETHLEEVIDRYVLDGADLVGFTSMFSQNVASIAMARLIKKRSPGTVVVMGGANCEAPMGKTIVDNVPSIDYVFSGPSLKSFPQLVACLREGDEAGADRINGVFSRRNRQLPAGCSSAAEIVQLDARSAVSGIGDELSIDEYIDLDYGPFLDTYEANFPGERPPVSLFFETSRGCWWGERAHCTFCGLNGSTMNYRAMRPELALRLFNSLFQHASRCSDLSSVDNILPKSYLTDVLPYTDTPREMTFFYEVKADLTEEDFRVLHKARVLRIQPGIEALNTSTLKLMRKGTSAFQNLQFLRNCVRYEISPGWNLLIGFPREEIGVYEKYLADVPLLTHLPPPGGVFPVRFDRFSPYFDEAAEYGLELKPLEWYRLTYPFGEDVLMNLAYYFADQNYGAQYAVNTAKMLTRLRQQVDRWINRWADGDRRPRLHLFDHDGGTHVHDSRSGTATEYPIHDGAARVLEALGTPKKLPALLSELPDVVVEDELAWLREKGLLFAEGDRLLSLLGPPPAPVAVPVGRIRSDLVGAPEPAAS